MMTFDAPSREVCTSRRIRTNTPLQALVTLNDPVYVEAAQSLARIAYARYDAEPQRLIYAFRRVLSRPPTDREIAVLLRTLKVARETFQADEAEATKMATIPLGALPADQKPAAMAAWTVVSNVILNLDETLARP